MARINPEQRLLMLLMALTASTQGLLKREIFEAVPGYTGPNDETISRKFERDKDTLRDLGILIEKLDSPEAPGDNTKTRYRVVKDDWVMPDVEFSTEEVALLQLAGQIWRDAALSSVVDTALLKLDALDVELDRSAIGIPPQIHTREPSFAPLHECVTNGIVVKFMYAKPGDSTPMLRTVTPYAVIFHEHRWHLVGFDHDRDAERIFLLSRITSTVTKANHIEPQPVPENAAADAQARLHTLHDKQVAEVKAKPLSVAAAALRARMDAEAKSTYDGEFMFLHYTDPTTFAEELAGFGPEVEVLHPEELREAVIKVLRQAVDSNRGAK